jgi:hypothetical protein
MKRVLLGEPNLFCPNSPSPVVDEYPFRARQLSFAHNANSAISLQESWSSAWFTSAPVFARAGDCFHSPFATLSFSRKNARAWLTGPSISLCVFRNSGEDFVAAYGSLLNKVQPLKSALLVIALWIVFARDRSESLRACASAYIPQSVDRS